MFSVSVDGERQIVQIILGGVVRVDEMRVFSDELRAIYDQLRGKRIKVLVDLRELRPSSPEVTEMMRANEQYAIAAGLVRAAELVERETVALQLNRVAAESGLAQRLRRFHDRHAAQAWLLDG